MENKKYFDYELAYEGLEEFKDNLNRYGIKKMKEMYNCSDDIDFNHIENYNYIAFHIEDNNIVVSVIPTENDIVVDSNINIVSYCGEEDSLDINDVKELEKRLSLCETKQARYGSDNVEMEKNSILKVINKLHSKKEQEERDINYFAFVIGFELLPKDLLEDFGVDELYDYAVSVSKDFVKSEEYKDLKHSGYEMLWKYFDNRGGKMQVFNNYFKGEK